MEDTSFHGLNEHYRRAKFGEDRTMRARCRCENVVFFLSRSESGAPCVRGVHSSNEHCVAVYRIVPFRLSFQRFQIHYTVLTFVARWRHNFREIVVKNCEKSTNRRKRLCAPLRIDS